MLYLRVVTRCGTQAWPPWQYHLYMSLTCLTYSLNTVVPAKGIQRPWDTVFASCRGLTSTGADTHLWVQRVLRLCRVFMTRETRQWGYCFLWVPQKSWAPWTAYHSRKMGGKWKQPTTQLTPVPRTPSPALHPKNAHPVSSLGQENRTAEAS